MADITVTVSGPVGCGKSAIAGEIEIALRAVGVPVRFADEKGEREEKNMTGADWASYIDMYKPTVVIVEQISRPPELDDEEASDPVCREADGCPTEKAVLQRFWREHHNTSPETRAASTESEGPVAWAVLDMDGGAFHSVHIFKEDAERVAFGLGTVVKLSGTDKP